MAVPALKFPGLETDKKFVSPHLRIGAVVYPQPKNNNPFIRRSNENLIRFGFTQKESVAGILEFTWNKQMGSPSGKWSMVLKEKVASDTGSAIYPLDDIIDGDWIDISVIRNGVAIPLCRGIVDSIREQKVSVGGATSKVVVLTGRDHGAFFEYPITYANIWARSLTEAVGGLLGQRIKNKVGGSPDEMFKAIIDAALGSNAPDSGQWELPPALLDILDQKNKKFYDLLRVVTFNATTSTEGLRGNYFNEIQLWTAGAQVLFQLLSFWSNPVLNEIIIDLLPPKSFLPKHGLDKFLTTKDKPLLISELSAEPFDTTKVQELSSLNSNFGEMAAIIRERPFPNTSDGISSAWFNLPTWNIPNWMLVSSDLGRSTHERFNLFELKVDFGIGSVPEQTILGKPQYLLSNIKTHGLRTYARTTNFYSRNGMGDWFEERKNWLELLTDWFAPNPYLRQGTAQIGTLLPEIRIGQRIILDSGDPKANEQFYCEGVNLRYIGPTASSGSSGQTSLMLTRGFKGTDEELMSNIVSLSTDYQDVF